MYKKSDYNLTSNDLHIIKNLVETIDYNNLVDVKKFFEYLKDFYTSKELISKFKIGTSSYYIFYSNYKKGQIVQNKFYNKMRDLFLHIYLGGLENEKE